MRRRTDSKAAVRLVIYVRPSVKRELEKKADAQKVSVSHLVNEALRKAGSA